MDKIGESVDGEEQGCQFDLKQKRMLSAFFFTVIKYNYLLPLPPPDGLPVVLGALTNPLPIGIIQFIG